MTCCAADRPARHLRRAATPLSAVLVLAVLCASLAPDAEARKPKRSEAVTFFDDLDVVRLVNLRLSPRYSNWLVGPIAHMATDEEEQAFLALADDAAAERFIDEFWQRRKPYPNRPDNPLREQFEARAGAADRLYTEGTHLGSHTARGTIFILYGGPGRTDYEIARDPRDPPVEVWFYGDDVTGLDGSRPAERYRFIKREDVTTFYTPRVGIQRARPVRPGS